MQTPNAPDTIVLIHGFWVTPRSWEHWKTYYEAKGFKVLTPAYPGFDVEVEALRADPTPIEELQVPEILDRIEKMIGELDRPPIIIGHSAGGVFTQILLDRGFGAAGVAMNSAPTEGVKVVPLSQIKSTFPILKNPANRHRAVGFTPEQWHYVFTNTFSEEESLALYDRYHIPASGRVFWTLNAATPYRSRNARSRISRIGTTGMSPPRDPRMTDTDHRAHRGLSIQGTSPVRLSRTRAFEQSGPTPRSTADVDTVDRPGLTTSTSEGEIDERCSHARR